MSRLSPSLKALINAPFARPGPNPSPSHMHEVYQSIAKDASQRKLGTRPWVTITAAATVTLNSPDSLSTLYQVASSVHPGIETQTAELIREVGLKCISFNGIPRTINCLNAFRASLPEDVASSLETRYSRQITRNYFETVKKRGQGLWDSVYAPFETKLYDKLATAHPDLPVVIVNSHYGAILSDPPKEKRGKFVDLGRVLTSVVAISCLRAQTGVGPQVLSHVFGLRKAFEDDTYKGDNLGEEEESMRWLAGDEGSEWILKTVDTVVEALGGSNVAPTARDSKI